MKTSLGMIWGSCDSCYRTPDTLYHQVCTLLSKQSLPLLSSRQPALQRAASGLFPFWSFHQTTNILPSHMTNLPLKSGLSPAWKCWATHSFWEVRVNDFWQYPGHILLPGRWPHRTLVQAAENPPQKLNCSQISFLNWPRVSTSVPTRAYTTEMCRRSLTYGGTFTVVKLQQQNPFWSRQFTPAEGVCSFPGGFCQLLLPPVHSFCCWITVTGYNFPSAHGGTAASQRAVIQHPPKARTNVGVFFPSPLRMQVHRLKQCHGEKGLETGIVLSSFPTMSYLQKPGKVCGKKGKQADFFVMHLFFIFQMGGERRKHRGKTTLLLFKLSISLPYH